MNPPACPKCGLQVPDAAICPDCGAPRNGTAPEAGGLPAGVPDGRLPPELREWSRQTFDVDAFMAGVRQIERTGGLELKDFLHELEEEGGNA
jgi:hypothetical protein